MEALIALLGVAGVAFVALLLIIKNVLYVCQPNEVLIFSGRAAVAKLKLQSRIAPLSPPLQRVYIYHYLHERHRDLAKKVGAVIQEMDASGELARLREQLVKQVLNEP